MCEYEKCGKRKLKSEFYGRKRFCTKSCAHAYSSSFNKSKLKNNQVKTSQKTKGAQNNKMKQNLKKPIRKSKQQSSDKADTWSNTKEQPNISRTIP